MQIGPFQTTNSERAKVKVRVRLNLHGIVFVESATVSFFGVRDPPSLTYNNLTYKHMMVNRAFVPVI